MALAILAAGAFAVGIIVATAAGRSERALVNQYVRAWARGDYARMYSLLDRRSRRQTDEAQFVAAYRHAAATATLTGIVPGHVGGKSGDTIAVRVQAQTRVFGTLREMLQVPLAGSGSGAGVRFSGTLLFPGLRPGEQLTRQMQLPPRAALLASDGTPLAQGPQRSSPDPELASEVVGTLEPIPPADAATYAAAGYPPDAKVGADGLERIFERQLAGTPGGMLLAGSRVLARTTPVPGADVHTTIDPTIQRAAIAARGGRYGGIAAMDPRTGAVLALSGVAYSALQPPGSTMKIITATAALEAGIVKLSDTFPVQTEAIIDGYRLQNDNGEACGGTFVEAFAQSCNSVFAPLGARLGAQRLVGAAERFGFNQPPSIPGASESTIPPASAITSRLEAGSSAIGQGKVETSALAMTDVAATIAMGGRRPAPTLLAGQQSSFIPVTTPAVADLVQRLMIAVVQSGTGTVAQIPGVQVAGKTGTAELRNTTATGKSSPQNTDSWFVAYAPVSAPTIAVGALFPAAGAGAQTAAPAVRQVLAAALHVG